MSRKRVSNTSLWCHILDLEKHVWDYFMPLLYKCPSFCSPKDWCSYAWTLLTEILFAFGDTDQLYFITLGTTFTAKCLHCQLTGNSAFYIREGDLFSFLESYLCSILLGLPFDFHSRFSSWNQEIIFHVTQSKCAKVNKKANLSWINKYRPQSCSQMIQLGKLPETQ